MSNNTKARNTKTMAQVTHVRDDSEDLNIEGKKIKAIRSQKIIKKPSVDKKINIEPVVVVDHPEMPSIMNNNKDEYDEYLKSFMMELPTETPEPTPLESYSNRYLGLDAASAHHRAETVLFPGSAAQL